MDLDIDTSKNFDEALSVPKEAAKTEAPVIVVDPPKVIVQKPQEPKGLATTERGELALMSLQDQLSFAKRLMSEKMISDTFKTEQQVVIGIQYAISLKLQPIVALKMMYVVNGRPCLFGDGPLSLCKNRGHVSKHREFFYDKEHKEICFANKNTNEKVYGACTQIWRSGDELCQEDYFTTDDMDRAGLDKSKFGKKDVWDKFERNMLRYKARSMALHAKFPDLIAGVPIAEYDDHFSPDVPGEFVKSETEAEKLNKLYLTEDKPA